MPRLTPLATLVAIVIAGGFVLVLALALYLTLFATVIAVGVGVVVIGVTESGDDLTDRIAATQTIQYSQTVFGAGGLLRALHHPLVDVNLPHLAADVTFQIEIVIIDMILPRRHHLRIAVTAIHADIIFYVMLGTGRCYVGGGLI